MLHSARSTRRFLSALFAVMGTGALVAACEAHVEQTCFDGVCPGDTTTGSGGTGGAGGAGGGSGGSGGTGAMPMCPMTAESGDFPCEIFDILTASCHHCHNALQENGAPIDLLTCDRFHENDCGTLFRLQTAQGYVRKKFMPIPSFPITEDQRKTLQDWLDA